MKNLRSHAILYLFLAYFLVIMLVSFLLEISDQPLFPLLERLSQQYSMMKILTNRIYTIYLVMMF